MKIKRFYVEFRLTFQKKELLLGINYEKKCYFLWIHPTEGDASQLPTAPVSNLKNLDLFLESDELQSLTAVISQKVPSNFEFKSLMEFYKDIAKVNA
mgnify:CR=1 FL=1